MKKLLLASAMFLSSVSAFAESDTYPVVIKSPRIFMSEVPPTAAVQPSVYITFESASCARQPLSVESSRNEEGAVTVTVVNKKTAVDCFGLAMFHKYRLQVEAGPSYYTVITNPIHVESLRAQ